MQKVRQGEFCHHQRHQRMPALQTRLEKVAPFLHMKASLKQGVRYLKGADMLLTCFHMCPGTYSNQEGASQCNLCPKGYNQTKEGTTGCQECPPGQVCA